MPHAPAGAGLASQTRGAGGRRLPGGVPGRDAVRDVPEANPDDVPEPAGHGHRGAAALLPGRRCGADGRVRQDHAGAAHGRGQRGPARDLCAGRPDAERQLPGPAGRQRHRHVEVLGRRAGRAGRRLRDGRPGGRHRPLARPLHDHGHRLDHDVSGRGPRYDAARRGVDPGRRLGALPDGRGQRRADRADGVGRPDPGGDPHPGGVRGCRRYRAGPRRLHQRADPPGRDGRPGRRRADPGRLRRDLPPGSRAGQHPPQRRVPDGGLLLRGRPARAARPAGHRARRAAPGPPHGQRGHVRRADHRRDRSTTRT